MSRSGPTMGDMTTPGETIADRDRREGRSPQRRIRIPDYPFYPAVQLAHDGDTELGAIVTELLDRYVRGEIDI